MATQEIIIHENSILRIIHRGQSILVSGGVNSDGTPFIHVSSDIVGQALRIGGTRRMVDSVFINRKPNIG